MADNGYVLEWHGEEIAQAMRVNGAKIISEFGLTVEAEAKKELRRGHGVLTGTLRRSIHYAPAGYAWEGDNVEPSAGAPERGGQLLTVEPSAGGEIRVEVGSGMVYAMAVNQRNEKHGSFEGYHYMTNGLNKAKGKLAAIIARHKVQK